MSLAPRVGFPPVTHSFRCRVRRSANDHSSFPQGPSPLANGLSFAQNQHWNVLGKGREHVLRCDCKTAHVAERWIFAIGIPFGDLLLRVSGDRPVARLYPFLAEDVPGLHLAYLRGSPIYHTLGDSVERVGLATLYHHGSYALGLARHFGEIDLAQPPPTKGAVYFTVGRWLLVRYPTGWAVPLAILVAALFAGSLVRRVNRGESSLRALLAGLSIMMVRVLLAIVVATLAWKILTGVRPSPGVVESYAYLLALLALSAGIWLATFRASAKNPARADVPGAVLLAWVVLAIVTSFLAPRISYLFAWPALAGSLVLLFSPSRGWWRVASLGLIALPTLVVIAPAIEVFFQMAVPRPGNVDSEMVEVVAVPILLATLSGALIASCHQRSSKTVMTPE